MMGRSHFVSGIVAFEATAAGMHYSFTQAVVGAVVVSSAALLPDIDHPQATISKTFGPVSAGVSRGIAALAGGHRKGTHCLAGILALGGIAHLCVTYRHQMLAMFVLSAILILTLAAGVRIFKIPGWIDDLAPIPVVMVVIGFTDLDLSTVPVALMLGCATHVVGDCLTNSGCPIFWPLSEKRFSLRLFKTGKWFEKWIMFPGLIVTAHGVALWQVWATIT